MIGMLPIMVMMPAIAAKGFATNKPEAPAINNPTPMVTKIGFAMIPNLDFFFIYSPYAKKHISNSIMQL